MPPTPRNLGSPHQSRTELKTTVLGNTSAATMATTATQARRITFFPEMALCGNVNPCLCLSVAVSLRVSVYFPVAESDAWN